jgi:predicted enzyme related to lactoylglutathione lyase
MPTTTQHAPGSFCWIELATTDQAGARDFYTRLFGYETHESPLESGAVYTTLRLGGRDAAALFPMDPTRYPRGTPPHWMTYVAVESADDAAAKVRSGGGQVTGEPADVMQYGRMALCADALGAHFCVWQPRSHAGFGVTGEPGAFAWCQLNVPASGGEKQKAFYATALGWSFRDDPMPLGLAYTTWLSGGEPRGGMMPMPPMVNAPAHWLVYLAASDVDATAAKAKTLGGQVFVPPTDIPGIGRFAVLADPQGALFAVVRFARAM